MHDPDIVCIGIALAEGVHSRILAEYGMSEESQQNPNVISFFCGECGNRIRVELELAGQQAECPTCLAQVTVPARSEVVEVDEETIESIGTDETEEPQSVVDESSVQEVEKSKSDRAPVTQLMSARLGVLAAILVIGVVVMAMNSGSSDTGPKKGVYFMDVETGDLVAVYGAMGEETPHNLENGHEVVRAFVFSCGKCEGAEMKIGYLEKWTPEAQSARGSGDREALNLLYEEGKASLIGKPDGKEWFGETTPEAEALMDIEKCGVRRRPDECYPVTK